MVWHKTRLFDGKDKIRSIAIYANKQKNLSYWQAITYRRVMLSILPYQLNRPHLQARKY